MANNLMAICQLQHLNNKLFNGSSVRTLNATTNKKSAMTTNLPFKAKKTKANGSAKHALCQKFAQHRSMIFPLKRQNKTMKSNSWPTCAEEGTIRTCLRTFLSIWASMKIKRGESWSKNTLTLPMLSS